LSTSSTMVIWGSAVMASSPSRGSTRACRDRGNRIRHRASNFFIATLFKSAV
tara:strand:+ start:104961 stop:105116 length:156 start_codon:yes stop_codon:yes gene_type:complete